MPPASEGASAASAGSMAAVSAAFSTWRLPEDSGRDTAASNSFFVR
jgi:hypothetical protein